MHDVPMLSRSNSRSHGGMYPPAADAKMPWEQFLRDVADRLDRLAEVENPNPRDLRDIAFELRCKAGMR